MFLKDLEAIRPSAIIDIIHSGESFVLDQPTIKSFKSLRKLLFATGSWLDHLPGLSVTETTY